MINFDCHAHIYENIQPIPDARYVPSDTAPLSKWLAHHKKHGITGGVIVQVSFLGTDNSELCAALTKLDPVRFAGIAVVSHDVTDEELGRLAATGVRGIRWNLVRGKDIPDVTSPQIQTLFAKLRRHDLHLELHLEAPRLAPMLAPVTDQGIKVVVDHFGLPSDPDPSSDPIIAATETLQDTSSLYFKFSAHYRTLFDLSGHAQKILAKVGSDHIVWGSDWPHTQHESNVDYANVQSLRHKWGIETDHAAVSALYGI